MSGQEVGLGLPVELRAPRVLSASALVRLFLLGVKVLALPDISLEVAENASVVMVAAATRCWDLPKLAAADDATEPLTHRVPPEGGAAPKRDAVIFDQTT